MANVASALTLLVDVLKWRKRRLWTGDGSMEPPEHVTRVRPATYFDDLVRADNGWWWVSRKDPEMPQPGDGWRWHSDECLRHGPYTEV